MRWLLALAMSVLLASSAAAGARKDKSTGFGLAPLPEAFRVKPYPQPDGAGFSITGRTEGFGSCLATFIRRPPAQSGAAGGGRPIHASLIEAAHTALQSGYRMGEVRDIQQGDAAGITFTFGWIHRSAPDDPRFMWALFETARGRATLRCYTSVARFDQTRPDFETIMRALIIPK